MGYISWLNEIRLSDKPWAGEKAASLGELIRAGLAVPRGFCLSAQAYQDTFIAHQLNKKISARLEAIDIGDPAQLEQAAEEIRDWIEHVPFSSETEQEIQSALGAMNSKQYAVRTSRVVQDVPDPTSSGLPQAFLAVPSSALLKTVRQCWATPWNSRAIYFRHRKKIAQEEVVVAVVVQSMIAADVGGVLFTASPLGARTDEIHIDAIWGLGEAVNAARWKPDHFVLDKATGAIREKNIANKPVMEIAAAEGGLQTIGLSEEKQTSACLTDAQLVALAEIGKKVEAHFRALQNIEWCRVGDTVYLLQTRSMTKK